MKLAVICPMGRDNAKALQANVRRQSFQDFQLVVAENGPGRGSCYTAGLVAHVVQSEHHQSHAKNAALAKARCLGATHWATFDDDDYYGPGYLAELVAAFEAGHRVVGKCAHFTRLASGNVIYSSGDVEDDLSNTEATGLQGPTLAAEFWDGMPLFQDTGRYGEDARWLRDVTALGVPMWTTSPFHFCYQRHGLGLGHTWPMRDADVERFALGHNFDVGAWGPGARRLIDGGDMAALLACRRLRPKPGREP